MHIERFFVSGLAHASYIVASGLEAVVVDPERNVDGYLAYLAKNGLKLRYIFLTHPHADFVAGHTELSARSGAPILLSEAAPATFPHGDLKDGDRFTVGSVDIEIITTPGHSPDSIFCVCSSPALPWLCFLAIHFLPGTSEDRICVIRKLVRANALP